MITGIRTLRGIARAHRISRIWMRRAEPFRKKLAVNPVLSRRGFLKASAGIAAQAALGKQAMRRLEKRVYAPGGLELLRQARRAKKRRYGGMLLRTLGAVMSNLG